MPVDQRKAPPLHKRRSFSDQESEIKNKNPNYQSIAKDPIRICISHSQKKHHITSTNVHIRHYLLNRRRFHHLVITQLQNQTIKEKIHKSHMGIIQTEMVWHNEKASKIELIDYPEEMGTELAQTTKTQIGNGSNELLRSPTSDSARERVRERWQWESGVISSSSESIYLRLGHSVENTTDCYSDSK